MVPSWSKQMTPNGSSSSSASDRSSMVNGSNGSSVAAEGEGGDEVDHVGFFSSTEKMARSRVTFGGGASVSGMGVDGRSAPAGSRLWRA